MQERAHRMLLEGTHGSGSSVLVTGCAAPPAPASPRAPGGRGPSAWRRGRVRAPRRGRGSSAGTVWALHQDRRGFLWAGTQDGLARYDGAAFTTFRPNPTDPNAIGAGHVWAIAETADGALWAGTDGGGAEPFRPGDRAVFDDPRRAGLCHRPARRALRRRGLRPRRRSGRALGRHPYRRLPDRPPHGPHRPAPRARRHAARRGARPGGDAQRRRLDCCGRLRPRPLRARDRQRRRLQPPRRRPGDAARRLGAQRR